MKLMASDRRHSDSAVAEAELYTPFSRCMTRSRKIVQFQHYCTDAPI